MTAFLCFQQHLRPEEKHPEFDVGFLIIEAGLIV